MLFMSNGYGTLPFLFFLLFFIAPAVTRLMAGLAHGGANTPHDDGAVTRNRSAVAAPAPVANPKATFAAAKRDLPGKLIDLDNELGNVEEFGTDLDASELKAARGHLNKAFAAYAQYFQGDYTPGVNVTAAVAAVADNIDLARRHMLLADPATAPQVAAADEGKKLAEVEAGRQAAGAAKGAADAEPAAMNEGWGYQDLFFGRPLAGATTGAMAHPMARPMPRRTSVQVTPFGIMIGSF